MREQHINEPTFDNINESLMLAQEDCFKTIDFNTVKQEDLAFISQYKNKISYDGELNGFAIWYGVWFSLNHVDIYLDGSPYNDKKIFSQLMIYLKNKTNVKKGDLVWGSIAFRNSPADKYKSELKISANLEERKYKTIQYYTIE